MNMNFPMLTAVVLGAMVAGCSTIDSSVIPSNPGSTTSLSSRTRDGTQQIAASATPPNANAPAPARGIAYFLPRQLAKVTAKRSELSLEKAIEALGKAEMAVSGAKAQVEATNVAIKETEDNLVAKGDIVLIRDLLQARLTAQKAGLGEAKASVTKKELERKAAGDTVTAAAQVGTGSTAKQYKVVVGIELLAPDADPRFAYRLSPRHSAFRDDDHKLVVSAGGLLTSTDIIAADRTADALVELATFAGAVSNPGAGRAAPEGSPPTPPRCPDIIPEEITAIVDLADAKQITRLNQTLGCMGARINQVDTPASFPPSLPSRTGNFDGIVYRTPIDVLVQIEKCQGKNGECIGDVGWFPTQVLALSLPQAGPISHVPQNAGLFTKTTYGLVFKDGILTNYNANRPSEVLEVARTPMRLLNGFFDGVSKIISIRTGQNNAQAGLANSQVSLLQAQNKILVEAITGKKNLTDADLAALQSADALGAAMAKSNPVKACVDEKVAKGESTDVCFAAK